MTKLTTMNATDRRQVARNHRVAAALAKTEKAGITGFSARYVTLSTKEAFHTAQAKLWEAASAHAEATGFVRIRT